jgi:flagellar basal-body rod protein FlgG
LQQSGNQLDLAINGSGFIQVNMPDGTTGYTRDGSLQVDGSGNLVTASGLTVAGGINIPAEAQSITVGKDGVVTVKLPANATPQQVGNIELASFINPAGLEPLGGNMYAETVASGNPVNGAPGSAGMGQLMQGYVETSNVNVVQELVTMIQTQRAYEMNSKAIQTSDQMLQRLAQL